ncbi:MAG: NAD-dependent epimerase/dehydratase family protein [Ruminococcaceae bacterium]|nr:NAD-dependent epimerase/dehydratase family protein [Oscillospiraceae bacterium]
MILIIGCGFLGQYLLKEICQSNDAQVLCTYHSQLPQLSFAAGERVRFVRCDVANTADLQALAAMCRGEALTVFYLAAFHNIDAVLENPAAARKVNVDGLQCFFETVKNIRNLYFSSTDCVYGESKPGEMPFCETDTCSPINEYGRQKLAAEKVVLAHGGYVFRLSLLYGASLCENTTFYDKTLAALQAGESVEMIDGIARNALPYSEAAKQVVTLAFEKKELPPILNVCGDRLMTKYELGLRIAEEAGASPSQVIKISPQEGKKFFKEKRADCIAMSNALLKALDK